MSGSVFHGNRITICRGRPLGRGSALWGVCLGAQSSMQGVQLDRRIATGGLASSRRQIADGGTCYANLRTDLGIRHAGLLEV